MGISILTTALGHPGLQLLLDLLFKSVLILSLLAASIGIIRSQLSSTTAHMLWLSGLVGIALLSVGKLLFSSAPLEWQGINTITMFVVSPNTETTGSDNTWNVGLVLVSVYLSMIVLLLLKLALSARQLLLLDRACHELDELNREEHAELIEQCTALCEQMNIRRKVLLKTGADVISPLSYGLWNPTILVPEQAADWSQTVRKEVLTHELSHIRRLDWLSLIFTQIVVSLFWINPLVWLASKRLHDEAEQACDTAIIKVEQDRVRYAENLLNIAKTHRSTVSNPVLAQPMYDGGELSMRIINILEGKITNSLSRRTMSALVLSISLLAIGSNGVQLFAAEKDPRDQEFLPIKTEVPLYPRRAADEGIEGWILYSFTVRADGLIDPNTVAVVDAEPPGIFETSAKNALLGFEFEPRVRDGLAVDVAGVQYLFRYELENDGNPGFNRPPPQANPR